MPFIYHRFDERSDCLAQRFRAKRMLSCWENVKNERHNSYVRIILRDICDEYVHFFASHSMLTCDFIPFSSSLFLPPDLPLERCITAAYLLPPIARKRHDTSVLCSPSHFLTLPRKFILYSSDSGVVFLFARWNDVAYHCHVAYHGIGSSGPVSRVGRVSHMRRV